MTLVPNGTADRLKYIAKTYASKPLIVIDMISVIAATVGEDSWRLQIREAAKVDPEFWKDAQRYGIYGEHGKWSPSAQNPPSDYVTAVIAMVSELPGFNRANPADPLFPWMATQLARAAKAVSRQGAVNPPDEYQSLLYRFRDRGTLLAQWFTDQPCDLTQVTAEDAFDSAAEWAEIEGEAAASPQPQGEIVYKFKDGYTVQKLTTKEQLNAEGDVMQHCVGSYCERVKREDTVIYSLRDPKGRSHATIEFDPHNRFVKQVKGKQNDEPNEKYKPYIDEFLATLPKMSPALEAIYNVLGQHSDVEEEHQAAMAREWQEEGFDAEDVMGWLKAGVDNASEAGRLSGEDVEPEELSSWPYPIRSRLWNHQGGDSAEFDWTIAIAKLYMEIQRLEPLRPTQPQTQMQFQIEEPPRTKRSRKRRDDWEFGWHTSDRVKKIEAEERRLVDAEGWYDADFTAKEIEPWYMEHFAPKLADRWAHDLDAEPETAVELRRRHVGPSQVEDAIRALRLDPHRIDNIDLVLEAVGIERNRRAPR